MEKNKYLRLTILLIGILNLSMTNINPYNLLTQTDWQEQIEQTDSAISALPDDENYWESFNDWRCFSTQNIELVAAEIDYGQSSLPTIRVQEGYYLYDFSMDPEEGLDWKKGFNDWYNLLANEKSFCVYSAYLQELPDDAYLDQGVKRWVLFVVDKIKTSKGYWIWYPTAETVRNSVETEW